jgi:hypothetical protein
MSRTTLVGAVTALVLIALVRPAPASNDIPQLDVEASCRAAEGAAMVVGRDGDNCRSDERSAKEALARDWDNFTGNDKTHCVALVKTGGPPSYVELLACLEVSRDARRIIQERSQHATERGAQGSETTGAGTASPSAR